MVRKKHKWKIISRIEIAISRTGHTPACMLGWTSRMGEGAMWVLSDSKCYTPLKQWQLLSLSIPIFLCCFCDFAEIYSESEQYGFPVQEGVPGTRENWCWGIWLCLQVHQTPWWMCLCHQTLQKASGRILRWVSVLAENCQWRWWACSWEAWWEGESVDLKVPDGWHEQKNGCCCTSKKLGEWGKIPLYKYWL